MKRISLIILSIVTIKIVFAQSVTDFQNHYSGEINWNAQTGALTISESGYLKFPIGTTYPYPYRQYFWQLPGGEDRKDYEYFIWVVPSNVNEIVIKANTVVNAAFHYEHGLKIRGENRNTSILYGSQIKDWNQCGNSYLLPNDGYWLSLVNKVAGNGVSEVSNITFLNPKVYCLSGSGYYNNSALNVYDCNFIDKRGGGTSNSDGIDTSDGSIIQNCYFETGDDNIKVTNGHIEVNNCTFNMIENSCPFNIGYGGYSNGASMNASDIRIVGSSGRTWDDSPIIQGGGSCYSNVTINIDDIYSNNSNTSLVHILTSEQNLSGTITNANLNINSYYSSVNLHFNSSMQICGQSSGNLAPGCSDIQYSGSTIDSYSIPQFAKDFICWNDGSNTYGSVNHIISNTQNGIHINYCCDYDAQHNNPENCGYSSITGCIIGTPFNPVIPDCAITNLNLDASDNINSGSENQSVSNQITATNTIFANASATYTAGNRVILKPGFKALFGSYFNAFIAACSSAKLANLFENNTVKNNGILDLEPLNRQNELNEKLQINPNPTEDVAIISYSLNEVDHITLTLFNATGKHLTTLAKNQPQLAGQHQMELAVGGLPTGIYYLKLQSKEMNVIKKLMVTK